MVRQLGWRSIKIDFMQSPIKAGLMAYGMSGRVFHAPFIYAHPGFELSAVVERHEKKAVERYPYITSYNQTEELLNDQQIDLIIVNTPNNTHFDLAKRSLQAGKHVLVEKPISATVAEVKELYDLSRQLNKHLMVY